MNPKYFSLSNKFKEIFRFKMQIDKGIFSLSFSEVRPSDSAMYYCATFFLAEFTFGGGTFLIVEGKYEHYPLLYRSHACAYPHVVLCWSVSLHSVKLF